MENVFTKALSKVVTALESEDIGYMIVGGFAVSYHNRGRTTNDIDIVIQIYPNDIEKILDHFPEWKPLQENFKADVLNGSLFNITDFETGIRYDFITYRDSDYNWTAFERRVKVKFLGQECYIASIEDLIISKLQWYNISKSDKQYEDLRFLLLDNQMDRNYIKIWVNRLNILTHGLLE